MALLFLFFGLREIYMSEVHVRIRKATKQHYCAEEEHRVAEHSG